MDKFIKTNCSLASEFYTEGDLPQHHIERIRTQLFGINSNQSFNYRHAESSNEGIARLAMTAHCSPFHFICELLQNVADAQARYKEHELLESTSHCCITLLDKDLWKNEESTSIIDDKRYNTLEEPVGCLILAYNELGWTNRDVEAIVKARESTKMSTVDCEYIGEKGQGFYSVFRIAIDAIIASGQQFDENLEKIGSTRDNKKKKELNEKYPQGGYFFKLTREPCPKSGFRYVVPTWIEPQSLPPLIKKMTSGKSILCLRLGALASLDIKNPIATNNKTNRNSKIKTRRVESSSSLPLASIKLLANIHNTLANFPKESLLFLKHPQHLILQCPETLACAEKTLSKKSFKDFNKFQLYSRVSIFRKVLMSHQVEMPYMKGNKTLSLNNLVNKNITILAQEYELTLLEENSVNDLVIQQSTYEKLRQLHQSHYSSYGIHDDILTLKKKVYLKVSIPVDIPKEIASKTNNRGCAKKRHFDFLFLIQDDADYSKKDLHIKQQDLSSWNVFACLPVETENSGLPAILNADFLLTASREQLDKSYEATAWNNFLLKRLPLAYCYALYYLAKERNFKYFHYVIDYLPLLTDELATTVPFCTTIEKTLEQLRSMPIIPVGWQTVSDTIYHENKTNQSSSSLFQKIGFYKPHETILMDMDLLYLLSEVCDEETMTEFCLRHKLVHNIFLFGKVNLRNFLFLPNDDKTTTSLNAHNQDKHVITQRLRRLLELGIRHCAQLKVEELTNILADIFKCPSFIKGSLQKANNLWWFRLWDTLTHFHAVYSNEFQSSIISMAAAEFWSQSPCLKHYLSISHVTSKLLVSWVSDNELQNTRFSDEQNRFSACLRHYLTLKLWNDTGCTAAKGMLCILCQSVVNPSALSTILDFLNDALMFPNDQTLTNILGTMDVLRLHPKFLHSDCWSTRTTEIVQEFEEIETTAADTIKHEATTFLQQSTDYDSNIKRSSQQNLSFSLNESEDHLCIRKPTGFPFILKFAFGVDYFNLQHYTTFLGTLMSRLALLISYNTEIQQHILKMNAKIVWSIIRFHETYYKTMTLIDRKEHVEDDDTVMTEGVKETHKYNNDAQLDKEKHLYNDSGLTRKRPNVAQSSSPSSLYNPLFQSFPRFIQPLYIMQKTSNPNGEITCAPPSVPVMMSQCIGTWTRLVDLPTEIKISGSSLRWGNGYILHDVYVEQRPNTISTDECKLLLSHYLSAIDWPDIGPPVLQRLVLSHRISEATHPGIFKPAPSKKRISQEFCEMFSMHSEEPTNHRLLSSSSDPLHGFFNCLVNDLEVFTVATDDIEHLCNSSDEWIQDISAPYWLQFQHPSIRYLWDIPSEDNIRSCEDLNNGDEELCYLHNHHLFIKALGLDYVLDVMRDVNTACKIRAFVNDIQIVELLISWLNVNFIDSSKQGPNKIFHGCYGYMCGAVPFTDHFESQLAYFLRVSAWLPTQYLGFHNRIPSPHMFNEYHKNNNNQNISVWKPPLGLFNIIINLNDHEDSTKKAQSFLPSSWGVALQYIQEVWCSKTTPNENQEKQQSLIFYILPSIASKITKRLGAYLGIIGHHQGDVCLAILRNLQLATSRVYTQSLKLFDATNQEKETFCHSLKPWENNVNKFYMHAILILKDYIIIHSINHIYAVVCILYRILELHQGPIVFEESVLDLRSVFDLYPLLFLPKIPYQISNYFKHSKKNWYLFGQRYLPQFWWRTSTNLLWNGELHMIEALNHYNFNCNDSEKLFDDKIDSFLKFSDTPWQAVSHIYEHDLCHYLKNFFCQTIQIEKQPSIQVFILNLKQLAKQLQDRFELDTINKKKGNAESIFKIIKAEGLPTFRALLDCIPDKVTEATSSLFSNKLMYGNNCIALVEQHLLQSNNPQNPTTSVFKQYYLCQPSQIFCIPEHLDIAHPCLQIFRRYFITHHDSRIPHLVNPNTFSSDLPNRKSCDAFYSLCRELGIPSIHNFITTQILRSSQDVVELNSSYLLLNTFPLLIRCILQTLILALFDTAPNIASIIVETGILMDMLHVEIYLEDVPALRCNYQFEYSSKTYLKDSLPTWQNHYDVNHENDVVLNLTSPEQRGIWIFCHPSSSSLCKNDMDTLHNNSLLNNPSHDINEDNENCKHAMERRLRQLRIKAYEKYNFSQSFRSLTTKSTTDLQSNSSSLRHHVLQIPFHTEIHISKNLLCPISLEDPSQDLRLLPGAEWQIARATLNYFDEICYLTPLTRCRIFQHLLSCAEHFVVTDGSPLLKHNDDDVFDLETAALSGLISKLPDSITSEIQRLFDDKPRMEETSIQSTNNKRTLRNEYKKFDILINNVNGEEKDVVNLDPTHVQIQQNVHSDGDAFELAAKTICLKSISCTALNEISVSWTATTSLQGYVAYIELLLISKKNMSPAISLGVKNFLLKEGHHYVTFINTRSLCRYCIRLCLANASENDDTKPPFTVDEQIFDCPLPTPLWDNASQQFRFENLIRITCANLFFPSKLEVLFGTGGWEEGPFYHFSNSNSILIDLHQRNLKNQNDTNDKPSNYSFDFSLPNDFKKKIIHIKLRSVSVNLEKNWSSMFTTVTTFLPNGFIQMQPPLLSLDRSTNFTNMTLLNDEDVLKFTNSKNILEFESNKKKKNLDISLNKKKSKKNNNFLQMADQDDDDDDDDDSQDNNKSDDDSNFSLPELKVEVSNAFSNITHNTSITNLTIKIDDIKSGCYVFLKPEVWKTKTAMIGHVYQLKIGTSIESHRIIIDRTYIPGRLVDSLRLDLGNNPFEVLAIGPLSKTNVRFISIGLSDIATVTYLEHYHPMQRPKINDDINELYYDGNSFDYISYLTSHPSTLFACRYELCNIKQRFGTGGKAILDILIQRLPLWILSTHLQSLSQAIDSMFNETQSQSYMTSAADIFAGGGGTSTGVSMAGFNVQWACEKDHFACQTWSRNHPHGRMFEGCVLELLQDIQLGCSGMPCPFGTRFLCGSSPCQGFSTLNVRGGVKDLANRGLITAVQNYIACLQPHYAMFENVVGMLSEEKDKITDFQQFLILLLDCGYSIQAKILSALDYGSPSERQRVVLIATHSTQSIIDWPKPTTQKPSYVSIRQAIYDLPRFFAPFTGHYSWSYYGDWGRYHHHSNHDDEGNVDTCVKPFKRHNQNKKRYPLHLYNHDTQIQSRLLPKRLHPDDYFNAFVTSPLQCAATHPDNEQSRIISLREELRAMTFPDSFIFHYGSSYDHYKQVGNAVPPILSYNIAKNILMHQSRSNALD